MPLRPGYGTKGKPVTLWANYFELIANGSQRLFRYSIEIKVPKGERELRARKARRIVELLLEDHFAQHLDHVATDYRSNLVSRGQLEIQEDGYPVRYRVEGEDEAPDDAKVYECILLETGTLSISELTDYLSSTRASELFGSKEEVIQSINIVMGQYCKAHPNIASVGANKHYDLSAANIQSMDLGSGLKAVRGFFISARAATARILLNVQVKNAAFYQEGPLYQLINVYAQGSGQNLFRIEAFLKRVRIKVTHIKKVNKAGVEIERIKTIAGLARPNDGQGSPHRPNVPRMGAGAGEVSFYIGDSQDPKGGDKAPAKSKGKKGKTPAQAGPAATASYITVAEFFKTREYLALSLLQVS